LLLGFLAFLFLFGQLCPVQRFEFKAHGAPPWRSGIAKDSMPFRAACMLALTLRGINRF
jgi:hypothetical protein